MTEVAKTIAALVMLTIAQILEQVPNLSDAELAELIAAEKAKDGGGRSTLIEALELVQLEREEAANEAAAPPDSDQTPESSDGGTLAAAAGDPPPAAEDSPAANDAAEFPVTDFRHPDYNGPLHGAQAEWRNAHLKRGG